MAPATIPTMTNFATKLLEFSAWLEEFTPSVLDDLGDPASAAVLAKLSNSYAGRVPDDVLAMYAWHDGGEIPDPWWELSDIDEVLRIKILHESIPELRVLKNWWSDAWIPVGADGDGNHMCVDLDGCFAGVPGQVLVFMHDEIERNIVAPSLGAYIEALLEACQAGILKYDKDEGFATDDNQDSWQRFLSTRLSGYPRTATAGE